MIKDKTTKMDRSNDVMWLWCGICNEYFHIFLDSDHISRCDVLHKEKTLKKQSDVKL